MKPILNFTLVCLLICSCKSRQINVNEKQSHILLEKALSESYKNIIEDDSINLELYTRGLNKKTLEGYITTIKLISESDPAITIDSLWFNDFYELDELIVRSQFDTWNPDVLKIENLNTQFQLNEDSNNNALNEVIEKDGLDHKAAYKIRLTYWVKEKGTFNIVSATQPVFSHNGTKAVVFTSVYNTGLAAWLFEKQDDDWGIISNLDIAVY